ncbi:B-cell linker protein [Gadus macrocephalus]|uniref:B-cell linker protein n=1 Tax=Gadus macrocephalus TaxID=80720 RepID=UPI0028CB57AB|nr:B-cell linker protein [Gadus macrocephalus]
MTIQVSAVIMEGRTRGTGSRQKLTLCRATEEPKYLETDGWEGNSDSMNHLSARSTSVVRNNDAPAVNRDLKPGRRDASLGHMEEVKHTLPEEQKEQLIEVPQRSSGSMLPKDLVHHIAALNLHRASRRRSSNAPRGLLHGDEWYSGACDRAEAEHALHLMNKDGAFLVRDCSGGTHSAPFVLAVYHEKKVYNIKIRFIEHKNKYALGTGKRENDMFDTVEDIIKFHSTFPIVLINLTTRTTQSPPNCILTNLITREDINRLLQ